MGINILNGNLLKFKKLDKTDFITFKVLDETKTKIRDAEKLLQKVIDESNSPVIPKSDEFNQVIKFFLDEENRSSYFSNPSRVKKLCWCLDYTDNQFTKSIIELGYLSTALETIESDFSPSCYSALIYILCSNWGNSDVDRLRRYLALKLKDETNQRMKVRYFQNNLSYISNNTGPIDWASQTFNSGERHLNIFYEKNPMIGYLKNTRYFKKFTLTYFETFLKNSRFENRSRWQEIIDFSKETYEDSLVKYLISFEISHFKNQINNDSIRDIIKNQAVKSIGDPNRKSYWKLPENEYHSYQIEIVEEARNVLNRWINETLVNIFFSKVVDDRDRRNFWMNYVSKMTTVDIFLSNYQLYSILNDPQVKDGLENRFGVLTSGGNTSSILIFTIAKYRFVLAGSIAGGALYVHPNTSGLYPKIEDIKSEWPFAGKRLRTLSKDSLVHSSLPNLIQEDSYYMNFYEEGRMVHNGNWQRRLGFWLNEKIQ
jgi:ferritin